MQTSTSTKKLVGYPQKMKMYCGRNFVPAFQWMCI